jgi:hypothetical protein
VVNKKDVFLILFTSFYLLMAKPVKGNRATRGTRLTKAAKVEFTESENTPTGPSKPTARAGER